MNSCAQATSTCEIDPAELARLRGLLDESITSSDQAILAAGKCVARIVGDARASVEASRGMVQAQKERTDSFMGRIDDTFIAHAAALERAAERGEHAAGAGRLVEQLASQARFLSLNARIEASRMGTGSVFVTIAAEMRDLSADIARANQVVEEAMKEVTASLTELHEQMGSMRRLVDGFAEELHDESVTDAALEQATGVGPIVDAAQEALGHLQFHDPMVQRLSEVRDALGGLIDAHGGAPIAADGEAEVIPLRPSDSTEAGEVLLF